MSSLGNDRLSGASGTDNLQNAAVMHRHGLPSLHRGPGAIHCDPFADTVRRLASVARELVQSQGLVIYMVGADGNAGHVLRAEEDERRCAAYFSGHHRNDPLAPHRIAGSEGAIGCLRERLGQGSDAARYEREFMRPYRLTDALEMLLPAGPDGVRYGISLLRDSPYPGFSSPQVRALADLHSMAVQLLHSLPGPPATPQEDARARLASRYPQLTQREMDIALAVGAGMPNKLAARHLDMSPATVKTHLHHIFRKCGITNRSELVRLAC